MSGSHAARLVIGALITGSLNGCSSDRFFVRRDGADLPVWRRGDPDAALTLVVQHGSGATGHVYDWMPAFDAIEERVEVVYWDQRGAGMAAGNPADSTLNVSVSVGDLELVLAAVRERWAPEGVVLLGHSLGGGLSQHYLRDAERAADIVGYVDVSGGRSLPEAWQEARSQLLLQARTLAAEPDRSAEERGMWEERAAFYEAREVFPREEPDRSTHAANVDAALLELGFDQAASTREMTGFLTGRAVGETLVGPFDALAYGANTARFTSTFDLDGAALTPDQVAPIEVPTLVLAGRFDLAVPPAVSERTAAALSGPVESVVLEDAAHWPMWDRPDAFAEAVLGFLDGLEE